MSTAIHYKSNLQDVFFNLFEVFDISETTLGKEPFGSMDEETARASLQGMEQLAVDVFAPGFAEADRTPLTLDGEGNVEIPEVLVKAMEEYFRAGWDKLELPEHLGGFGAPPTVVWSAFEMVVGANAPLAFYLFGTFISRAIDRLGTESQKDMFVHPIIDRNWGGSMALTEPDAGSDVGAGRTKARLVEGDVWELEGTKRFITNGDYHSVENIIHLVLARPEGGNTGTRGLSLFIVPKFLVNEDGSLGERNGAVVTGLEKKMGLTASATCELTLGADKPCIGYLAGGVHEGIRQMFTIIEYARMAVGMKSLSTLSTAYLNALQYTKERVQGPDLAKALEKDSPRVRIIEHPDVRRMLMVQKSHAEGMRALALYAAWLQDQIAILSRTDEEKAQELILLKELLLPLVKGYCSHRTYEILGNESLQCFGGAGYVKDFPIEQYIRDQKIDSLYEGTTHIQSLDLFFRKILRDQGETLKGLFGRIQQTLDDEAGGDALADERAALARGLQDMQGVFLAMMAKVPESIYHAGLQGNRILLGLAELVIGWRLLVQSSVALRQLAAEEADRTLPKSFYQGKVAGARFFCLNVLPRLTLVRKLVEKGTLDLMEVPEEAF